MWRDPRTVDFSENVAFFAPHEAGASDAGSAALFTSGLPSGRPCLFAEKSKSGHEIRNTFEVRERNNTLPFFLEIILNNIDNCNTIVEFDVNNCVYADLT